MNEFFGLGRLLIIIGLVITGIGIIVALGSKLPWIGRLPGDIYFKGERFTFYFPITTCILVSVLLTIFFWLMGRK
ncbi:MAG: DUF2905 domain-containing protein [Syntrophales bacterium]|nr:DUF2905 domain-containing protein [Syntrophales bacterium]